jgi:hypothetical protein
VSSRFSRFKQKQRWIRDHPILEVAFVALFTAAVSWLVPFASVSNSELVADLFRECDDSKVGTFCGNEESFNIAMLLLFCMITKIVLLMVANGILILLKSRNSCGCWSVHTSDDCWCMSRSDCWNVCLVVYPRVSFIVMVFALSSVISR